MKDKSKQLEVLIKYLIAVKMEIEEQNGVTTCKNCGVDFSKIIDTLFKEVERI